MRDDYAKKSALEFPDTAGTVIHAIVKSQYGEEAYNWDPLTVYLELRDDFGSEPDQSCMEKWAALQIVMTTGAFFQRLDAFLGVCNTLASGEPFFHVFDPVTVEEAAWGITEVALNREMLPFNPAIKVYLEKVLAQDGYAGDYPAVFEEVFEARPDASDVRTGLAALDNNENVEGFINEQLKNMIYQFNKIPSLKDVDDIILQRGMDELDLKSSTEES